MRCLLIADADMATREAPMLHRLVIGLLDAGVHVTHAVPESVADTIEPSLGVETIGYRHTGLPWTLSTRTRDLLEDFNAATAVSASDAGIVHVFGVGALPVALRAASLGELAVVIDVHSRAMAARLARAAESSTDAVLLAASSGIATALRTASPSEAFVRECPWGVPKREASPPSSRESITIAAGGSGRDPSAWEAMLRGLSRASTAIDSLEIFLDANAADHAKLSPLIGTLGLSPIVSRIPDFEARRDLVIRADMMVWPEQLGETRSIVLDAMAAGTPVLAVGDADVAALDGRSGVALVSGDALDWAAAIESFAASPEQRALVGERSAAYVRDSHRASVHVDAITDAYEVAVARSGTGRVPPRQDAHA
ncbi:MAG: hypothetical protein AAFR96_06415 [Planctomycetota bacterium]